MNSRTVLTLIVIVFCLVCAAMIVQTGVFRFCTASDGPCILLQSTTGNANVAVKTAGEEIPKITAVEARTFTADNATPKDIVLGSLDVNSGFMFQLDLSSKGAAVSKVTLSKFDDRNYENPAPLVLLSPVRSGDGRETLSMANTEFVFTDSKVQLGLDRLNWQCFDVEGTDSSQTAKFEAVIKDKTTGEPVIKLTKTYQVTANSYHIDCNLTVENLSPAEQKIRFNLTGPAGINKEDLRSDTRKAVAGFRDAQGNVVSTRLDVKKLGKATTVEQTRLVQPGGSFLWAAITNKYFAAILVPLPAQGKDFCDWVSDRTAQFYNPDQQADSGDENITLNLKVASSTLAPAGEAACCKTYNFRLYLGPKDKGFFDSSEQYKKLGFAQTIDFMSCCCPAAMIYPLVFGILGLMKWLYPYLLHNYGIVIIVLVLLVRLVLHPLTKKGQVSMSKMTKLGPKSEEIKQKYADDKAEMNRRMMALYKEHGASPVIGMLPTFVQMPIWIALYSAIDASIDLRGASFLPFWITDLSAPDAIYSFSAVKIPLLGVLDSVNLLPILMGIAFYLQQKLMPAQATSTANPQAAQQQKMMMIMLPIMMPLALYKAPSGLNLYIMASVFGGVVEQYVIKKHIREKEKAEVQGLVAVTSKTGGKLKKKKPKPFFRT